MYRKTGSRGATIIAQSLPAGLRFRAQLLRILSCLESRGDIPGPDAVGNDELFPKGSL